jgi:hypothetical protein
MIKINLQNASNGVIKTVTDNQYNGADQTAEIIKVYEIEDEKSETYFDRVSELLFDVARDLCLYTGSDLGPIKMDIVIDWGLGYLPTEEEIDSRIKELKTEIKELQNFKKSVKEIND